MNERIYVNSSKDIPKTVHFAAIVFDSVWIEGDERSKTNPGHGYPGYSKQTLSYIVFKDLDSLTEWIKENEPKTHYVIIESRQVTIEKTISIKVA